MYPPTHIYTLILHKQGYTNYIGYYKKGLNPYLKDLEYFSKYFGYHPPNHIKNTQDAHYE